MESIRCFLAAAAYDRAVEMARPILRFMQTYGQLVDVAAIAAEILETLPREQENYYLICDYEAGALYALGATDQAKTRYREIHEILSRRARAEPGRADYQRDLSVSYNKMGDLFQALGQGEQALEAYQKDLDIAKRLARAEPGRADLQWDLVVSLWRVAGYAEDGGKAQLNRALGILRKLDAGGRRIRNSRCG